MPKILVKGGIWKNTEDEILKVAVMKYGKNQWSRIASLLHRKTAKQCKSRWYEWLDPGIKKTEWTREEDEKLLHLAKLMPTQWRTIAPMVGRTANQCLERYEYLLDQAQIQESGLGDSEDPRKLRPGEVDPNPETKPARPDAVDMDEDELEMLSEARARLANTQGKKAKRKAREKQLDEARRLATLQKKRELRAAGVNLILLNKLKRCCDLNFEIPFEKKAPNGFFDTSNESIDPTSEEFKELRLKEYTRRDRTELLERRKDKEKFEKMKESNIMYTMKKTTPSIPSRRSKLVLPNPQISEAELEEVVKVGAEAEIAKSYVSSDTDNLPTKSLLYDYAMTPISAMESSGMRTPMPTDTVMRDAQTLLALNMVETPLKGGQNVAIDEDDLNMTSAKPRSGVNQTPNTVLASPYVTPGRTNYGEKEFTPLRDNLSINKDSSAYSSASGTPVVSAQRHAVNQVLRRQLESLPKAVDDFEIEFPDMDIEEETKGTRPIVPDAAEEYEREHGLKLMKEQKRRVIKSQNMRRKLPIPKMFESDRRLSRLFEYDDEVMVKAEESVIEEIKRMLDHDINAMYPEFDDEFELEELDAAKALIDAEVAKVTEDELAAILKKVRERNEGEREDVTVENLRKELDGAQAQLLKNENNVKKSGSKLKILYGGYVNRFEKMMKELSIITENMRIGEMELQSYTALQRREEYYSKRRLQRAEIDLEDAKELERDLQRMYASILENK